MRPKQKPLISPRLLQCDDAGAGGGEPGQHKRPHLLPLRPLHPKGKLLCHDQVGKLKI